MRDIVTKETGTFFTGLSALPAITTTQTSAWIDLSAYNGATVYILAGTWTDGTFTPVIKESEDGSTDLGAAAAADLVAWKATSATVFTPVRVGASQPAVISSAATAVNQRIGYIGGHRYIRVVTTVTGSPGTGCTYDVIIQVGEARVIPPAV
jgi:hypothetical protein